MIKPTTKFTYKCGSQILKFTQDRIITLVSTSVKITYDHGHVALVVCDFPWKNHITPTHIEHNSDKIKFVIQSMMNLTCKFIFGCDFDNHNYEYEENSQVCF